MEEKDKPLCSKQFTVEEVTRLKKAIEEYYYFELLCGSSISSDFCSCCHNLCLINGVILPQMTCLFTALSALWTETSTTSSRTSSSTSSITRIRYGPSFILLLFHLFFFRPSAPVTVTDRAT